MTALLTDERVEDASVEWADSPDAVFTSASDDFKQGARFARDFYEARLAKDAKVRAGLVEALEEIKSCMGGDNCDGWDNPNAVWGLADAALAAVKEVK